MPTRIALLPCAAIATVKSIKCYFNSPIMAGWQQIIMPETRLFLTHGHLYHLGALPPLRHGDVLAYGHTHLPQAQWQGDIICFNPGSVSIPKGEYPASYGMLDKGVLQVLTLQGDEIVARLALKN